MLRQGQRNVQQSALGRCNRRRWKAASQWCVQHSKQPMRDCATASCEAPGSASREGVRLIDGRPTDGRLGATDWTASLTSFVFSFTTAGASFWNSCGRATRRREATLLASSATVMTLHCTGCMESSKMHAVILNY